jgi:hypothetical protein
LDTESDTLFRMPRPRKEKVRERRITHEIVVDAYDEWERAMGWYYYLDDRIRFPFRACCNKRRAISPLKKNEEVDVVGLPPEEECAREMLVTVRWRDRTLAVPLSQLAVVKADSATRRAVADWHYWVEQDYVF